MQPQRLQRGPSPRCVHYFLFVAISTLLHQKHDCCFLPLFSVDSQPEWK